MPGQAPGLDGAKEKWASYLTAVPDLRVTIEELVAEGDKVGVRRSYEGTRQGELLGIPAAGKRLQVGSISIFRLAPTSGRGRQPAPPAARRVLSLMGSTVRSGARGNAPGAAGSARILRATTRRRYRSEAGWRHIGHRGGPPGGANSPAASNPYRSYSRLLRSLVASR